MHAHYTTPRECQQMHWSDKCLHGDTVQNYSAIQIGAATIHCRFQPEQPNCMLLDGYLHVTCACACACVSRILTLDHIVQYRNTNVVCAVLEHYFNVSASEFASPDFSISMFVLPLIYIQLEFAYMDRW